MKLFFNSPAEQWTQALPVGNGRLGAMVFGGVHAEHLQLNEATLWSGEPEDGNNADAREVLPLVREAITAGEYHQADALSMKMQGPYTQSYQPLGDLHLKFAGDESPIDYRNELDLDRAVVTTTYRTANTVFTREVFSSYPDQVIVVRLTADKPGSLNFSATLDSLQNHQLSIHNHGLLCLTGRAPSHVDPNYLKSENPIRREEGKGTAFEIRLVAILQGGSLNTADGSIQIKAADAVTLLLSAATSFNGFDRSPSRNGRDPSVDCSRHLSAANTCSYQDLLARHVMDHQALFQRVSLDLGRVDELEKLPTDQRLAQYHQADDPGLAALLFHYGRYLLIASSRPGGQPANLQGIWNDMLRPPWSSNYTININTQMNYWPSESCNLSECHQPLLDFISQLAVNGAKTASTNYGLSGWVAHHNSDIWRTTNPVGQGHGTPVWANWAAGGAWLCQHLWEHFAFNGDENFLRDFAWPVLKSSAEFYLGWLFDDGKGHLVTAPSVSPELTFLAPDGKPASVSQASTMDMGIIWDLFTNCIEAAELLKIDTDFADQLKQARERLLPCQIGSRGQLQELSLDFTESEVHHRHTSHLFGLHPGRQIIPRRSPDLATAIRKTLEIRGDAGTGWALGWKINHWARLHDGDDAYKMIRNLFTPAATGAVEYEGGGLYPNLFDAHPPFQIDGNFAYTAGIAEMLLQSHTGEIELLPALPTQWQSGSVSGLRARGGFEIDITWQSGHLKNVKVRSRLGRPCTLRLGEKVKIVQLSAGESVVLEAI
jgi:alpha-L-fucosidase 2